MRACVHAYIYVYSRAHSVREFLANRRHNSNESPYYILARRLRDSNPLMILGSYFRKQFHIAFTPFDSVPSPGRPVRKPGGLSIFFFPREPVALGFHRSFGAPNFDPLHVFFNYFSTARATVASVCPGYPRSHFAHSV